MLAIPAYAVGKKFRQMLFVALAEEALIDGAANLRGAARAEDEQAAATVEVAVEPLREVLEEIWRKSNSYGPLRPGLASRTSHRRL